MGAAATHGARATATPVPAGPGAPEAPRGSREGGHPPLVPLLHLLPPHSPISQAARRTLLATRPHTRGTCPVSRRCAHTRAARSWLASHTPWEVYLKCKNFLVFKTGNRLLFMYLSCMNSISVSFTALSWKSSTSNGGFRWDIKWPPPGRAPGAGLEEGPPNRPGWAAALHHVPAYLPK